jgi:hypothetical protein
MYTILKPEIARNVELIESYLAKYNFNILSIHAVPDWNRLAKKIYAPQRENDSVFASELEVYLWLTNHFFGNNAITLLLQGKDNGILDLQRLAMMKSKLREELYVLDDSIKIMVDLDKADISQQIKTGQIGVLSVGNLPAINGNSKGRWDNFFFKYI